MADEIEQIAVGQAQVMLDEHDMPYFVSFVILGEASRLPSRRTQKETFRGLWLGGQLRPKSRGSDRVLRHTVCVEVLARVKGISVFKAAAELAHILGKTKESEVQVIRTRYNQNPLSVREAQLSIGLFLQWRVWVLESTEEVLELFLGLPSTPPLARKQLRKLFDDIRADPSQTVRNRQWLFDRGSPWALV
jgi:hypothetical protein